MQFIHYVNFAAYGLAMTNIALFIFLFLPEKKRNFLREKVLRPNPAVYFFCLNVFIIIFSLIMYFVPAMTERIL